MRAAGLYREWIDNGDEKLYIGVGKGKSMTLHWPGVNETLQFRNRKSMLKWLMACPESVVFAGDVGSPPVRVGTVAELARAAGL